MVDSADPRRIATGGRGGGDGRTHARGEAGEAEGGRKNGRSRGTEPRHGSHASTPITRDSLTIGFPLAVTEIYRKPPSPHLLCPPASGLGRFRESAARKRDRLLRYALMRLQTLIPDLQ